MAAVTKAQDWATITAGDPTGSMTIGSGTSRLLVAVLHYEWTGKLNTDPPTWSVGGQSNTGLHELYYDIPSEGDDLHVYIYYWNEAAIDAMSGSSITFSDASVAGKQAWSYATFDNVDQSSPATFNDATGAAVKQSTPLSVTTTGSTGDYVVIPTTCRAEAGVNWDGVITEQYELQDSDQGGATYALASDAYSQGSHTTYQATTDRYQAAVGMVIKQEASTLIAAAYHYNRMRNPF